MNKIVISSNASIRFCDPRDYIIIKNYKQHISDKYVTSLGTKFNIYNKVSIFHSLEKGDLIIKEIYRMDFYLDSQNFDICFVNRKYYEHYRGSNVGYENVLNNFENRNSVIDFNDMKKYIMKIFSQNMKLKIEL